MVTSSVCGILFALLIADVSLAGSDPILDRTPVCVKNGPSAVRALGAKLDEQIEKTKKALDLGLVKIPKGCTVVIDLTRENTGRDSEEVLHSLTYVRYVRCQDPIRVGAQSFDSIDFDIRGCLEKGDPIFDIRICNRTYAAGTSLYFKDGVIDCKKTEDPPW